MDDATKAQAPPVVDARMPTLHRWMFVGLFALLIAFSLATAVDSADRVQASWRLLFFGALAVLLWRGRLTADAAGITSTQFRTRRIGWDEVTRFQASGRGWFSRFKGPHLEVREGSPVALNPMWRSDGHRLPHLMQQWAQAMDVPVEGSLDDDRTMRTRLVVAAVAIAVTAIVAITLGVSLV